tara:strand:- start:821 stop:1366 length:546 start_codon:yes stop_codon:yes gene_type:complete
MVFSGNWETDLGILEEYMKTVEYKTPTSRMTKFKIPQKIGGSILYGWTWRSYISPTKNREFDETKNRYKTTIMTARPELWGVFTEFRDFYFPDFIFTGVQLNKNYRILPHKDGANIGQSYLVSMGNYENGGKVIVDRGYKIDMYDGRKAPITFNGSKFYHWTQNWESGDRYSIVFFNDKKD